MTLDFSFLYFFTLMLVTLDFKFLFFDLSCLFSLRSVLAEKTHNFVGIAVNPN